MLRNLGSVEKFKHEIKGGNHRLDTIQAIILNEKIKYIDSSSLNKKKLISFLNILIATIKSIILGTYISVPTEGPFNLVNYDEGYYANDDGFDSKTMTLVPGSLVVLYESTNRTTKEISIEDITPSVDSFSLSSGYMSLNNQVSISDVLQLVIRYKYTNN